MTSRAKGDGWISSRSTLRSAVGGDSCALWILVEGAHADDVAAAGSIIVAQLEAAARFEEDGALHPEEPARPGVAGRRDRGILRREARAESACVRLLHAVEVRSGSRTREQAELSLLIVLGMLCSRVTPGEARHLIAQLPSKPHPELEQVMVRAAPMTWARPGSRRGTMCAPPRPS